MGPSIFSIEGEYELGRKGVASVEASYGMEGFDSVFISETFRNPGHAELKSDAFLLQDKFGFDGPASVCGGTAVFKGKFLLGAKKSHGSLESEILIDKKEREQVTIWGWDYSSCIKDRPSHCDGIAGDPALKDVYPECHN